MKSPRIARLVFLALAAAGSGCSAGAGADPSSELLVLPLDEGSGTVTYDASGHGLRGELSGGAAWVEGASGSALSFGVPGAELRVDYDPGGSETVALELWLRLDASAGGETSLVAGSAYSWMLQSRGGALAFLVHSGHWDDWRTVVASDDGALAADRWQQVRVTFDGSRAELHVDGVLAGSAPTTERLRGADTASFYLGGSAGRCFGDVVASFPGAIDEVRLSEGTGPPSGD